MSQHLDILKVGDVLEVKGYVLLVLFDTVKFCSICFSEFAFVILQANQKAEIQSKHEKTNWHGNLINPRHCILVGISHKYLFINFRSLF